jgi:hypothetical protein
MLSLSILGPISLSLLTFLAIFPGRLHSQAIPTAEKNTEYSVFAAYSLVSPNYYNAIAPNSGVTFGGDYTHMFPRNFALSIEPRITFAPGDTVGEKTFGGGFRFEYRIKRLIPYGDYIWSYGIVTFTHPTSSYVRDDAYVTSPGLGIDCYLTSQWAARVDYQFEHWTLEPGHSFNPRALSFGVVYRFPFKPYIHN